MANSTTVTNNGNNGAGKAGPHPDYTAFVLVPVFFLLGLLGVVICHVLKRKGYRCTTAQEDEDQIEDEYKDPELGGELNDTVSDNDTVGHIVQYIMKNEANSDALKAMVHDNSIDSDGGVSAVREHVQRCFGPDIRRGEGVGLEEEVPVTVDESNPPLTPTSLSPSTPPSTPVSPGAPPGAAKHTCNHLHTIGGPGGQKNICTRCSQKKWPLIRKPSARKAEQRRSHYGEVTVLSVGRFRVTKCEKPAKERRTLLITDSNGSVPSTPTETEPHSRTVSESQQETKDDLDKEK
ncbi:RELT-like protein 1 isoform X1 [Cololabis saira]|uniref:RELT-like protein 1 isoform X1 n=1 Tax=Cololabis saira TaxID=129043 RepID=UPI002AD5868C|nr:RELT-like protein 1 isoform X1 [Cololabis saira]